ncbi:SRPBCC family protein [Mucilaginibacter lacusdianchii]|uniref:SRPBCC family protein n=1 Tax=Mucilaginibacter lacusdianchii TaxID=2684211 RepID=UPI00131D3F69|nr:SRPBCC family protein [Mucilaginibacter sp. JXJ CY 39]
MPIIRLQTIINAPVERCFDLSRSIDLHTISTKHTGEQAVRGRTSGLIELGESVTWRARHFGIWQYLTSKITAMQPPYFFVDEMVSGTFRSFRHEHQFTSVEGKTVMVDKFNYTSPFRILGRLADYLFLETYMTKLLEQRNAVIKAFAESDRWQQVLKK